MLCAYSTYPYSQQILGLFNGPLILQLLRGIPNHFGYTALFLLTIV